MATPAWGIAGKTITPKSTTNTLKIDVVLNVSTSAADSNIVAALFQDAVANALAAASVYSGPAANDQTTLKQIKFTHYMVAGTTSEITFRVRIGPSAVATVTFNGSAGTRLLGGVLASSITITELRP